MQPKTMTARYPSICAICNTKHIMPGTNIIQINNGWAHEDCWNKDNAPKLDLPEVIQITEDEPIIQSEGVTLPEITPEPEETIVKELTKDQAEEIKKDAHSSISIICYGLDKDWVKNTSPQSERLDIKREMQKVLSTLSLLPDDPNSMDKLATVCFNNDIITVNNLNDIIGTTVELNKDKTIKELRPQSE